MLASASPRRQELLKKAGIQFVVRPADIPEVPAPGESPLAFGERMAREKARVVHQSIPNAIVLAADTVVAVDQQIFGKPENLDDAVRMLRLLSGRIHCVITSVCLKGHNFEDVRSENTTVEFAAITDYEIREYVRSGEPMDKAGAYAVQGMASRWITKVDGDYYNVVGLPVDLVWRMLREYGVV